MTATDDNVTALLDVIDRQFDAVRALLATLQSERDGLTQLDTDAIDAAGTKKLEQLRHIEALEDERAALLDLYDLDATTFPHVDASGALDGKWRKLLELLARCNELNDSNGALVAAQRRQVEDALTVLSGESPDVGVYGPDGMPSNAGRTTTLATA